MFNIAAKRIVLTPATLLLGAAAFLVLFENHTYFSLTMAAYPMSVPNLLRVASVAVLLICIILILLAPWCYRHTTKPLLITVILISAILTYFIDTYGTIFDDVMLDSILRTDMHETRDLVSKQFFYYFILLGLLPAGLIALAPVRYQALRRELLARLKLVVGSVLVAGLVLISFGSFYASYFREHKALRYYVNPVYFFYSSANFLADHLPAEAQEFTPVGTDAHKAISTREPELVILVVGETARSDHFSLNGYARDTNPALRGEATYSFTNTWSCGTTTAVSVPCMFSLSTRDDFDLDTVASTENVLDVLQRAGVHVLWRDNNSDSKNVALRVDYEEFNTPELNPSCDLECRDEGMLANLQDYINGRPNEDMLIVLHQMGNHGPAYYKRYPESFARFTPVCTTNLLEQCSPDEINNSYDNSILYTDYFLSRVIQLLKDNDEGFRTAMLYVSDHGESLGENNLYLHGLPYLIAPSEQKHVPMLLWFGNKLRRQYAAELALPGQVDIHYSHDNLSHTLLGLLEVQTSVYDEQLDILSPRINSSVAQVHANFDP